MNEPRCKTRDQDYTIRIINPENNVSTMHKFNCRQPAAVDCRPALASAQLSMASAWHEGAGNRLVGHHRHEDLIVLIWVAWTRAITGEPPTQTFVLEHSDSANGSTKFGSSRCWEDPEGAQASRLKVAAGRQRKRLAWLPSQPRPVGRAKSIAIRAQNSAEKRLPAC
jgi:hypothetical protein